jgi:hypothetical protein
MDFGGAVALAVMRRFHREMMCDRKASDLAPALLGTTGSAECGLQVIVRQARDRQFEYLNAQQGVLEDGSGDE